MQKREQKYFLGKSMQKREQKVFLRKSMQKVFFKKRQQKYFLYLLSLISVESKMPIYL